MKNKGFTLTELLAVIVILSVLVIIAAPVVQNAFSNAKSSIGSLEKKNIDDTAERIVLEIINCDYSDNIYDILNISNTLTCSEINDLVVGNTISNIDITKLKTYGYFNDVGNKCNGTISITTDAESYQVTVDTTNVTCS